MAQAAVVIQLREARFGAGGQLVTPQAEEAPFVAQEQQRGPVMRPGENAQALRPGRAPMVSIRRRQLTLRPALQVVQPKLTCAADVADEGQPAPVWRKLRLQDGRVLVAGQHARVDAARQALVILFQCEQAQGRAVPGHLRLVPGDAGNCLAIGMPGRLHDEVTCREEFRGPGLAGAIHQRQTILAFMAVDIGQPAPVRGDPRRCYCAEARRDGLRFATRQRLPIEAALRPGEENLARGHGEIAAAVAHQRAHGQFRRQVARGILSLLCDEDALGATIFKPHEGIAGPVPLYVNQTQPGRQ